jgi:hypothetical protein
MASPTGLSMGFGDRVFRLADFVSGGATTGVNGVDVTELLDVDNDVDNEEDDDNSNDDDEDMNTGCW